MIAGGGLWLGVSGSGTGDVILALRWYTTEGIASQPSEGFLGPKGQLFTLMARWHAEV